tara:strand:+ start:1391 stop:1507 length:117 start_codon:yes stop_codon:yes gene_type:complete
MNPVSKVKIIVEAITNVFEELKPTYQLKLNLCSEDLKK